MADESDRELIAELAAPSPVDPDRQIAAASELAKRGNKVDKNLRMSTLVDAKQPKQVRAFMIDLLAGSSEPIENVPQIKDLLTNGQLDSDLSARAIARFSFSKESSGLLHNLVLKHTDIVAFQALKTLSVVDPDDARSLSWDIVNSVAHQSDDRLSAAYKTLAHVEAKSDVSARNYLITKLSSTLNRPSASAELRDAAFFALSEMKSVRALTEIMNSKYEEPELVGGAIDENAAMLLELLKNDPDDAILRLIVRAMEIHPIFEFADPLKAAATKVKSQDLRQQIARLVERIPEAGVPLNSKWGKE